VKLETLGGKPPGEPLRRRRLFAAGSLFSCKRLLQWTVANSRKEELACSQTNDSTSPGTATASGRSMMGKTSSVSVSTRFILVSVDCIFVASKPRFFGALLRWCFFLQLPLASC